MAYQIDDNVSIPSDDIRPQRGQYKELRRALHQLEVGQSFQMTTVVEQGRCRSTITRERRDFGTKFTLRKDKEPGTFRVWRTK